MKRLKPKILETQFLLDADTHAKKMYAEAYMKEDKVTAFLAGVNFALKELELKEVKE